MPRRRWPIVLLAGLLLALFLGAATFDRTLWPHLVGDEATYLMGAESLAFDGDYQYSAADFERFRSRWGLDPEGLILQRGDDGRLYYAKPLLWPLFASPFVRLVGIRGPFVANALALALAALVAAWTLSGLTGPWAPTWIAASIFGSVTFAWVFWAHSDLLLMALVTLGLAAIVTASHAERERNRFSTPSPFAWLPWCVAGALLAAVVWSRPPYLVLLLPVLVALPPGRRRVTFSAFALGAVLISGILLMSQSARTESYSAYGGVRRSFYSHTGWPDVGSSGTAARARFDDQAGDAAWEGPLGALEVARWGSDRLGWNTVYTLFGRHVGLLPYFAPLLLLPIIGWPRNGLAWSLVGAVALAALFFALNRPTNFWGGGGSLANRYLLPILPALWFVPTRTTRPWAAALAALVAAPFLWPLWVAPRAAPLDLDGTMRWVAPASKALFPFETTQSHLKPAGIEDIVHHNLWIKFLDRGVLPHEGELTCPTLTRGSILVGTTSPIRLLRLTTAADTTIEVGAARQVDERRQAGTREIDLVPELRAHHKMWWGDDPLYLYQLAFRCRPPAAVPPTFSLEAVGFGEPGS